MMPNESPATSNPSLPMAAFDLEAQLQEAAAASEASFRDLLALTVSRLVPDPQAAEEALRTGAFVVDDTLVVMRLNPQTDYIEFFGDIGLPADHQHEQAYRALLEMNLCRAHPGVTFGVHPESGRLVASQAMHALVIADEEVCIGVANRLARLARELREGREVPLA